MPEILAHAKLKRLSGKSKSAQADLKSAQADLERAGSIATRGGFKLCQADCGLQFTLLYLACGDIDQAKESLERAEKMIREMGYHRRDKEVEEIRAAVEQDHKKRESYRLLTKQPDIIAPPIGKKRVMGPQTGDSPAQQPAASGAKTSSLRLEDRLTLIRTLNALVPPLFEALLFAIKPTRGWYLAGRRRRETGRLRCFSGPRDRGLWTVAGGEDVGGDPERNVGLSEQVVRWCFSERL